MFLSTGICDPRGANSETRGEHSRVCRLLSVTADASAVDSRLPSTPTSLALAVECGVFWYSGGVGDEIPTSSKLKLRCVGLFVCLSFLCFIFFLP